MCKREYALRPVESFCNSFIDVNIECCMFFFFAYHVNLTLPPSAASMRVLQHHRRLHRQPLPALRQLREEVGAAQDVRPVQAAVRLRARHGQPEKGERGRPNDR